MSDERRRGRGQPCKYLVQHHARLRRGQRHMLWVLVGEATSESERIWFSTKSDDHSLRARTGKQRSLDSMRHICRRNAFARTRRPHILCINSLFLSPFSLSLSLSLSHSLPLSLLKIIVNRSFFFRVATSPTSPAMGFRPSICSSQL